MDLVSRISVVITGLLIAATCPMTNSAPTIRMEAGGEYWVYVGTARYNDDRPTRTLYLCRFSSKTGALKIVGVAAKTLNPGFLAVHPGEHFLYAVNEIGEYQGQKNGAISSFRIDHNSGKLTLLNQVPAPGANPAYVTVSRNGKYAIVASYYGGVASRPIGVDGSLGDPSASVQMGVAGYAPHQENSHPHSVVLSPDQRFAIIPDLGLSRVFAYRFDEATGALLPNDPGFWQSSEGSGPRHVAFTPDGRFAYAINEMQSSLSALSYDARSGAFQHLETVSTLPADFKDRNTGAEVEVAASGNFVYASNRGRNSIAVFAIDPAKGTLASVQEVPTGGKTPRNFAIDPTGNFLLVGNQDSDEIVVFHVDQRSGHLAGTGEKVDVPSPVCLSFVRVQ